MKQLSLLSRLLAVVLVVCALIGNLGLAQGNIIYVDSAAAPNGNGQSWATAYNSLNSALQVGNYQVGDTVWVAQGTYYPGDTLRTATFFLRTGLVVMGGFPSGAAALGQRDPDLYTTILSGDIGLRGDTSDNAYHVVTSSFTDATAVLDGFSITGGNANNFAAGAVNGGGILNFVSPNFTGATLRNLRVYENYARYNGGGIYCHQNSPFIENCWVGNNAANEGGNLFNGNNASPEIWRTTFENGRATSYGGGVHVYEGYPIFIGCDIVGNSAGIFGGGLHVRDSADVVLVSCKIRGNESTRDGGGVYVAEWARTRIIGSLISGNRAGVTGGGIYLASTREALFLNSDVVSNYAPLYGGLNTQSADPYFYNSIIYHNRDIAPGPLQRDQVNSLVSNRVFNSIIEGLLGNLGTQNSNRNPLFVNPISALSTPSTAGNYRLQSLSPAIDFGNLFFLPTDSYDLDRDGNSFEAWPVDIDFQVRVQNMGVDAGCYELSGTCASASPGQLIVQPDTVIACQGDTVQLSAQMGPFVVYNWSTQDSISSIEVTTSGLYTLTLTDTAGCTATDSVHVIFAPNPNVQIESQLSSGEFGVCQGQILPLRVNNLPTSYNYAWSNGTQGVGANTTLVTSGNQISVAVTDSLGCTGRDTVGVSFFSLPSAMVSPSGTQQICPTRDSLLLVVNGFSLVSWLRNGTSLNLTDSSIYASLPGNYYALVRDTNGCSSFSNVVAVQYAPTPTIDSLTPVPAPPFCQGDSSTLSGGTFAAYQWNTGATTPSINVRQTGYYELVAFNAQGCSDTLGRSLIFEAPPSAQIDTTAGLTLCPGSGVPLRVANPPTGAQFRWSTGDSTTQILAITTGLYWVEVTTSAGCQARDSVIIRQGPDVRPTITGPTSICPGDTVVLDAGFFPNVTYQWSPGGATTQTIQLTRGGSYSVLVTHPSGCRGSDLASVVQKGSPPIGINGNQDLCPGDSLRLQSVFPYLFYRWNTGATTSAITVKQPGLYWLEGTAPNGCKARDTAIVSPATAPSPQIVVLNGDSSAFCVGDSIQLDGGPGYAQYQWSTGDTTRILTVSQSQTVVLTVTNAQGCHGRDTLLTQAVSLPEPVIQPSGPTQMCAGESIFLSVGGFSSYQWNTNQTTSQITVDSTGLYTVTVSNGLGCRGIDSLNVTVSPNPIPQITSTQNFLCTGDTLLLSVTGTYQDYLWSNGSLTAFIRVATGGSYRVQVTDSVGCQGADTLAVTQFPKPNFAIRSSASTSFCEGGSVQLEVPITLAYYRWNTNDTTRSIVVSTNGWYWVEGTNVNGCTLRDSIFVRVFPRPQPDIQVTGRTDLCQGDTAVLSSLQSHLTYRWTRNGAFISANRSLVVRSQPGTYILAVTDSAGGCIGRDTVQITVSNSVLKPDIQISGRGGETICQGDTVSLLVGQYSSYQWNTGQTTRTITAFDTGRYVITVRDNRGCLGKDSVHLRYASPLNPAITTVAGSVSFCGGDSAILSVANGPYAQYLWTGPGVNGSRASASTLTVKRQGVYSVQVSDIYGCEAPVVSRFIQVFPRPSFGIVASDTSTQYCQGDSVILYAGNFPLIRWSTGSRDDTITARTSGVYQVTVTDTNNCTSTSQLALTFFNNPAPQITSTGGQVLCPAETTSLQAGTYAQYSWRYLQSTLSTNASVSVSQAGSYTVVVEDANGCLGRDTLSLRSVVPRQVDIEPDTTVFLCVDRSVSFDAGSGFERYSWSTGDTTSAINLLGSQSGTYTVVATDTNGCVSLDTARLVGYPLPQPDFGVTGPLSVCSGDSTVLDPGAFASYAWDDGTTQRTLMPRTSDRDSLYRVIVTDSNGCVSLTSIVVEVRPTTFVDFIGLDSNYCDNSAGDFLIPTNGPGTFLGPGIINGNFFDPTGVNPGILEIRYAYQAANGCRDTATKRVVVFPTNDTLSFVNLPAAVCENSPPIVLQASTSGGTFSGPGVVGNRLIPDSLASGTMVQIRYAYSGGNGCQNEVTDSVDVLRSPPVSFSGLDTSYCIGDLPAIITLGASYANFTLLNTRNGAVQSGGGVIEYDPGLAGPGPDTVRLEVVNPGNQCISQFELPTVVYPTPTLSVTPPRDSFCLFSPAIDLTPFLSPVLQSPFGSVTIQAPGEQPLATTLFDPTKTGNHIVRYRYVDPNTGCLGRVFDTLFVNPLPQVSLFRPNGGPLVPLCPNDPPDTLVGSPVGGYYSGLGITDSTVGLFYPSIPGAGQYILRYTYTDAKGCTDDAAISVRVNAIQNLSWTNLVDSICANLPRINLGDFARPLATGGNATGTFIDGNSRPISRFFDPSLGPGTYTVGYAYDSASCGDTIFKDIRVDSVPEVSFFAIPDSTPIPSLYCLENLAIPLRGQPANGTFFGKGIQSAFYNPSRAGVGPDTVVYEFTDNNTCTGRDTQIVAVQPRPDAQLLDAFGDPLQDTALYIFCKNDLPVQLNGVPPGGGFYVQEADSNRFSLTDSVSRYTIRPARLDTGQTIFQYVFDNGIPGCVDSAFYNALRVGNKRVNFVDLQNFYCASPETEIVLQTNPSTGSNRFLVNGESATFFRADRPGLYVVQHLFFGYQGAFCPDTLTDTVRVRALPLVGINNLSSAYCAEDLEVDLAVLPAGGTLRGLGVDSLNYSFNPGRVPRTGDTTYVTLTYSYTDSLGCSDTVGRVTRILNQPTARFRTETPQVCLGERTILLSETPGPNIWDFGDGTVLSGVNIDGRYTYKEPGIYDISFIAGSGACRDTSYGTTEVIALPEAGIVGDSLVYLGNRGYYSEVSLGANEFSWSVRGNNEVQEAGPNFNYLFPDTGRFTLQMVAINTIEGCQDTTFYRVRVGRRPAQEYVLGIYPNPAESPLVNLNLNLDEASDVRVRIYDTRGRLVREQSFENLGAGLQRLQLEIGGLAKGVYPIEIIGNPVAESQGEIEPGVLEPFGVKFYVKRKLMILRELR